MKCLSRTSISLVALTAPLCPADSFTFSHHEASGWGMAQVFDGGDAVTDGGILTDPTDPDFRFRARDLTSAGSYGASAKASGISDIVPQTGGGFRVLVEFRAVYDPSPYAAGDRPGGMAEGELFSLIEFVMPTDRIEWAYGFIISDTAGFEGSASAAVENVTRSQTILTLTETTGASTYLVANRGDVIRITSNMSGSGSGPAGSIASRQYGAEVDMIFRIPEPATFALVLAGGAALTIRRRT